MQLTGQNWRNWRITCPSATQTQIPHVLARDPTQDRVVTCQRQTPQIMVLFVALQLNYSELHHTDWYMFHLLSDLIICHLPEWVVEMMVAMKSCLFMFQLAMLATKWTEWQDGPLLCNKLKKIHLREGTERNDKKPQLILTFRNLASYI